MASNTSHGSHSHFTNDEEVLKFPFDKETTVLTAKFGTNEDKEATYNTALRLKQKIGIITSLWLQLYTSSENTPQSPHFIKHFGGGKKFDSASNWTLEHVVALRAFFAPIEKSSLVIPKEFVPSGILRSSLKGRC